MFVRERERVREVLLIDGVLVCYSFLRLHSLLSSSISQFKTALI